jgi:hypothetical protein
MSLIKKVDVPKYLAARRALARDAAQQAIRPNAIEISALKLVEVKATEAGFIQDFSLEHSSSGSPLPPKE